MRARQTRRRLPIGFQVWLGTGTLLVLLAGSIVLAIVLLWTTTHREERLNDRAVPYLNATAAAALDAKGVANDERGFLMTGNRKFIAEADRRATRVRAAFRAAAAAATSQAERGALIEARDGFDTWLAAVRREFAAFQGGQRQAPIRAALGHNRELRKRYETALTSAQALGAHALRSADASVDAASSRSVTILLVCLVVSLLAGAGIAWWLVRSIASPLARLVTILGRAERLDVVR
jgi:methyl-accepting chemotaxis protein